MPNFRKRKGDSSTLANLLTWLCFPKHRRCGFGRSTDGLLGDKSVAIEMVSRPAQTESNDYTKAAPSFDDERFHPWNLVRQNTIAAFDAKAASLGPCAPR